MKKIAVCFISMFLCVVTVYALTNDFDLDLSKLSISTNSSNNSTVLDSFNDEYALDTKVTSENSALKEEITNLTKKTTYLLLGKSLETDEEYYKRHREYLNLGAYNFFPYDKEKGEYDDSYPNSSYAFVSEFAVPSMFLQFDEVVEDYGYFGDVFVSTTDDENNLIISSIALPNVTMKLENKDVPMKYDSVKENLVITYFFVKIKDKYALAYLYGEYGDDLETYFTNVEDSENKNVTNMAPSYESNLSSIYDFSKLNAISNDKINKIYNNNKNNIVIISSYYNNYLVSNGNGFFITDGLVVTTWNFIENALKDAQYFVIKDDFGKVYELDGVVTVNIESDLAVLKLKEAVKRKVNLGDSSSLKIEDPVISISSKTGVGFTTSKGIVTSNDSFVQTSIPVTKADNGSPLFDINGNVVGINTIKQVNASTSLSVGTESLKEVYNKFKNKKFSSIDTISFDELKDKYFYTKYSNEVVNKDIPKRVWNKYSKIGNIEKTINLELFKSSYDDGVVSLRYKNNISNYISSMQLASKFIKQLEKDGFKEKMSDGKKNIYENNKYRVIIMDEFNYLIVVMVKL